MTAFRHHFSGAEEFEEAWAMVEILWGKLVTSSRPKNPDIFDKKARYSRKYAYVNLYSLGGLEA
jgi:hypothetical protein